MLLNTFFPDRARPRTVVHAGRLLLQKQGCLRMLGRYLRLPRRREVFVVHHGEDAVRGVAQHTGVTDIKLVDVSAEENTRATTELALALGATRIDFTIDEAAVRSPGGRRLRRIPLHEAERLAGEPGLRAGLAPRLRAGCAAIRNGVARVRIGNPSALLSDDATTLVRDSTMAAAANESPQPDADPEKKALTPVHPQLRLESFAGDATDALLRGAEYRGHEIGVPVNEPTEALHDPWWRLRGTRAQVTG